MLTVCINPLIKRHAIDKSTLLLLLPTVITFGNNNYKVLLSMVDMSLRGCL